MSEKDIVDPRVVPRWVEAGVSGLARGREWDAIAVVELGELEGSAVSELAFRVLADGTVVASGPPKAVLARLVEELAPTLRPPYEARATRRGRREWTLVGRELRLEEVTLPELDAAEVALALAPDGGRMLLVDGEEPLRLTGELEAAAAELERLGRERFRAFVARAERGPNGRWELTVDPL